MIPTSRPQISLLLPLENTIAAIYEILLLPLSVVSKTSATINFSSLKGRFPLTVGSAPLVPLVLEVQNPSPREISGVRDEVHWRI